MSQDVTAQDKPSLESLISHPGFSRTVQNLASEFIRTYYNSQMIETADLLSEALLAATTAYQTFDHTRGVSFKTYAYPYMRHAVQTYCNKFCHSLTISEKAARYDLKRMTEIGILRLDQSPLQFDQDDSGSESTNTTSCDTRLCLPDAASGIYTKIDMDEFFFAGFSATERELAREFLLNDLSIRELSIKYDISKSRVGSILSDLRNRMQEKARQYVEED